MLFLHFIHFIQSFFHIVFPETVKYKKEDDDTRDEGEYKKEGVEKVHHRDDELFGGSIAYSPPLINFFMITGE